MRPRLRAELDATIDHIRRVQCRDEFVEDLDATLGWLEEARDTLLSCRDEGMSDPAASIYALRELRRKLPLRAHDSSRDEDWGMGDTTDSSVPSIPDEEDHLSRGQVASKNTNHAPRKPRSPGRKRPEATAKHSRCNAELVELEQYRGQAVDARLEGGGGELERKGLIGHMKTLYRENICGKIITKETASSNGKSLISPLNKRIAKIVCVLLSREEAVVAIVERTLGCD